MHDNNIQKNGYDFNLLGACHKPLQEFVHQNEHGKTTIDFFNPKAVIALNKALLLHFYKLQYWDIPANYLCPPIPGRADYIHHLADLLGDEYTIHKNKQHHIQCLDIGTGANLIYPLLGNRIMRWRFVATDIDKQAMNNAKKIVSENNLDKEINLRVQESRDYFFKGIIQKNEIYTFSMCNPPFHASAKEASEAALRKQKNLGNETTGKPKLNFGGQTNELWCEGGEKAFLKNMIYESSEYRHQCIWFTALISQEKNIPSLERILSNIDGEEYRIINMSQGNKKSRFIAWTFFTPKQRKKYFEMLAV